MCTSSFLLLFSPIPRHKLNRIHHTQKRIPEKDRKIIASFHETELFSIFSLYLAATVEKKKGAMSHPALTRAVYFSFL
jgi:hypothetical protein